MRPPTEAASPSVLCQRLLMRRIRKATAPATARTMNTTQKISRNGLPVSTSTGLAFAHSSVETRNSIRFHITPPMLCAKHSMVNWMCARRRQGLKFQTQNRPLFDSKSATRVQNRPAPKIGPKAPWIVEAYFGARPDREIGIQSPCANPFLLSLAALMSDSSAGEPIFYSSMHNESVFFELPDLRSDEELSRILRRATLNTSAVFAAAGARLASIGGGKGQCRTMRPPGISKSSPRKLRPFLGRPLLVGAAVSAFSSSFS